MLAHIRGGEDLEDNGMKVIKRKILLGFIDCSKFVIDQKYTLQNIYMLKVVLQVDY
jgi:protease II